MSLGDDWTAGLLTYIHEGQSRRTLDRGLQYAKNGHVRRINGEGQEVSALVKGSGGSQYITDLWLAGDKYIEGECDCPVSLDCKHCYAVAYALLASAWKHKCLDPEKIDWISGPSAASVLNRMATFLGDAAALFLDARTAPEPETKPMQGAWWRGFLDAETREERHRILEKVVGHLERGRSSWWQRAFPFGQVLDRENPIDALKQFCARFNQYAAYYGRNNELGADFEAFLESDEAAEIHAEHQREISFLQLTRWLQSQEVLPEMTYDRLEVEWSLFSDTYGLPVLTGCALLTSKKMRRKPRTYNALEQLQRDVRSKKRLFPEDEISLLDWVTGEGFSSYVDEGHRGKPVRFAICNLIGWNRFLDEGKLVHWRGGGPVRLDPRLAHLAVVPAEGDMLEWRVAIPGTGGAEAEVLLPIEVGRIVCEAPRSGYTKLDQPVTLYAIRGETLFRIDTGTVPYQAITAITYMPTFSAQRVRDSGVGTALVTRLLKSNLQDRTSIVQEVPVRPRLEFWRDAKTISVCVTAQGETGGRFVYLPGSGWRQAETVVIEGEALELESLHPEEKSEAAQALDPLAVAPHAIAIRPRLKDVEETEAWLRKLIPGYGKTAPCPSGLHGTVFRLTGEEERGFFSLWQQRPKGADYFGNKAFADYFRPTHIPAMRIKAEPSGLDFFAVSVAFEADFAQISLDDIERSLHADMQQLVRLPNGRSYLREELETYRDQTESLAAMGLEAGVEGQRVHALSLASGAGQQFLDTVGVSPALEALREKTQQLVRNFKGIPKLQFSKDLKGILRPYQAQGVEFLVWAAKAFGGGLLADDMGLGKTLQVLAALRHLQGNGKKRLPSLVVCPASVAHNWQREAERFVPDLKVVVIERGQDRKAIHKKLSEYDLVIKNYALTRRDAEVLKQQQWLMLCVDEAQAIKNPSSIIAKTVKDLDAKYRVALTGTPIENRLTDLWSIMDFAVPGYLPSLESFEARMKDLDQRLAYKTLRARLRPVLMRRMKGEVAPELPPRIEERRDCAMLPEQRKIYLRELKAARMLLDGSAGNSVVGKQRIQILAALTRLRQICCEPAVLGHTKAPSGKTEVLMETLIPLMESGEKVLVFSQFVRVLSRLEERLTKEGIRTYVLTGKTGKRGELVDAFEADSEACVFLISLKAGGSGLNLTSAAHVLLFDPWWNPAVEAQAIDRTHRIGQNRTVVAWRLVSEGTVEERILSLQEKKRELVKNIFDEGAFNRTLNKDDFQFLLGEG